VPSVTARLVAACIVATLAFWAYTRTLVPGVEPGDSAGFQSAVLWPERSARQAYPLYYALARPAVGAMAPANPARGLNLFSAIWGALAVGILAGLTSTLTRSLAAGVAGALLLAFSYTFWSQAIIAEVYTLHLALIGACLFAVHRYVAQPGEGRLLIFCAVYAVSFGNHLSMILVAPAFAWAILRATPDRAALVRPRTVARVALIVAGASLQYLPNLMAVWTSPDAPAGIAATLGAFWFDVTKADWRQTMVAGVDAAQGPDRLAMWWFDVRQQFGVVGTGLAVAGAVVLFRRSRLWATTLGLAWIVSSVFALTYNVGDAHVFFLPAHFVMAIFTGAAVAWPSALRKKVPCAAAVLLVIGYAGWRGWDTWPILDRHLDRRGEQVVTRLTTGVSSANALLLTQMDWQIENVLLYQTRFVRQDLTWRRLPDVLLRWPSLVEETHRAGRDVVLSAEAARQVISAFGSAYPVADDPIPPAVTLAEAVSRVPRGAPYVIALLPPPRGTADDPETAAAALRALTGGQAPVLAPGPYRVVAGLAGEAAAFARSERHPFRESFQLLGDEMTVRMESWLSIDTFRRAGFGHVLRGREQVLIAERGVSFVWFRPDGTPAEPFYAAGIFAARPRFRVAAAAPRLAQARP
jgi:hypothetical protein